MVKGVSVGAGLHRSQSWPESHIFTVQLLPRLLLIYLDNTNTDVRSGLRFTTNLSKWLRLSHRCMTL